MPMLRKILKNPQATIGLTLIVLLCLIAVLAPILAPNDPGLVNPSIRYQAPSAQYPLGTDQLGRCELSRLLYGARASLGLAFPALIVLGGISLLLGTLSACRGGWLDRIVTSLYNIFIAFPSLIIAAAVIGALGNGLENLVIAVVISMWARFTQLIRTYALTELSRGYITAAKVAGCGTAKIMFRYVIPNIMPQFIVYFSTGVAAAILTVSSFAFLGLGLPSGTAEWGMMLSDAQTALYSHPEFLIYPGVCILVAASGFNLFGEALRDILQPEDDAI
jgi:peptide/nickel transport system permease protein